MRGPATGLGVPPPPYLEMLEKGGDTRNLQAETPGAASSSINTGGGGELILLESRRCRFSSPGSAAGEATPGSGNPKKESQRLLKPHGFVCSRVREKKTTPTALNTLHRVQMHRLRSQRKGRR